MTRPTIARAEASPAFKGFSGTADLAPCLVITGPNKAGKTSLLHTILAGIGGVTASGPRRTAKATEVQPVRLPVAEIPEGAVITLTLSTGPAVDRVLTSGRKETERADALASELIGRPLVDVRTLADSTPGQARANMAACLTAGDLVAGWDIATAYAATEAHMLTALGELTDGTARDAWLAPLVEWARKLPKNPVADKDLQDDGGGWMTALCPLVETSVTDLNRSKTAADGAWKSAQKSPPVAPPQDRAKARADYSRAAVALSAADSMTEAGARYEAALTAWTTERNRLSGEVERITTEGKARREALAALQSAPLPEVEAHLLAELDAANAAPVPELEPVAPLYGEAVDRARAALDAPIPGPAAAEVARLEGLIREADAEVVRLAGEVERLTAEHAAALAAEEAATDDVGDVQGSLNEVDERIRQHRADLAAIEALHADGSCKTCGDVDPYGLRGRAEAIRATLADAEKEQAARLAILSDARDAHTAAAGKLTSAGIALDAATEAHAAARNELALSLRPALARLTDPAAAERIRAAQRADLARVEENYRQERRRLDAAHLAAATAHGDRIEAAERAITRRRASIAAARASEVADAEAALSRLRASVGSVMAAQKAHSEPPTPPSSEPVDRAALTAEVARCQAIEGAWTDYESHLSRHRDAERAADAASLAWRAATCLVQSLRLAIADLAATAVQPIQAAMDAVVADLPPAIGIRPYYLAPDDFGVVQPTGETTRYRDCSGAEQIVVEAALGVALAALQGCPIPLCTIDELARIQDDHIPGVLHALLCAQKRGAIAQIICTMPLADDAEMAERRLALVRDIPGVSVLDVRTLRRPSVAPSVAPASPAVVVSEQSDLPF